jgi:hypothetical protein
MTETATAGGIQCAECGQPFQRKKRGRPAKFCSARCCYRHRDRRDYERNPDAERERARRYYWNHRDQVRAKAAAKRHAAGIAFASRQSG